MRTMVISPHLDDAVLSLGQFLATRPGSVVVTVLAGVPPADGTVTAYDAEHGFATSAESVEQRQREDAEALRRLDATAVHLPFLDRQYMIHPEPIEIIAAIDTLLRARPGIGWEVYTPLGIGHYDHYLVGDLARAACKVGIDRVFAYEELPYRVWAPEQVVTSFERIAEQGWAHAALPHPIQQGARATKIEALSCYASQLDPPYDPCFLVPERAWHLDRVPCD